MKAPFSQRPAAPKSWWGTWSGQAFLVVVLVAGIVIFFGIMGWGGAAVMTQPLQIPLILLTAFPLLLNWLNPAFRCWQHAIDGGMVVLVVTDAELIPTNYLSMEVPAATLSGPRGSTIRGMIFRDLIRQLDTGVSFK